MSLNRRTSWLAAWLWGFLMAAPAWSQGLADAQLFAPAEMDQFGGGPRANEGVFCSADFVRWTISAPEKTPIGFPDLTRKVYFTPDRFTIQSNTHDTGFLGANWTDGERFELGDVSGHNGWLFSFTRLHSQVQEMSFNGIDVVFQDLEYGDPAHKHLEGFVAFPSVEDDDITYTDFVLRDLPCSFGDTRVENRVNLWSLEWNYFHRFHPTHYGGTWELFFGARYMELEERFKVEANGERFFYSASDPPWPIGPRHILADSYWATDAENHIVGPQVAARYFRKSGRWTLSSEGRFFAGFNMQNLRQTGTLGSKLREPWPRSDQFPDLEATVTMDEGIWYPYIPLTMTPTSFKHTAHAREWSPAAELRIDAKYQITKALSFRVGWNAFWIDGIARASNLVDYTLSEKTVMGIRMSENRQGVLMYGWTIGAELNR